MLMSFIQKRREKNIRSLQDELSHISSRIKMILEENEVMRAISTQKARESAGHPDETWPARQVAQATDLQHNYTLLGRLTAEKREIERKLQRNAS